MIFVQIGAIEMDYINAFWGRRTDLRACTDIDGKKPS